MNRNESQPVEIPNAGCVFKNPKDNKAAILIDQCGLKGTILWRSNGFIQTCKFYREL